MMAGCSGVVGDAPPVAIVAAADAGGSAVDAASVLADDAEPGLADAFAAPDDAALAVPFDDAAVALAPDALVAPDAGPVRVPVFVAVGKQGRRAISCDDGVTWSHDESFDEAWPEADRFRCFTGAGTDCDHNAWSSTSLEHHDGVFIHTLGWGAPGTFYRSTNGITWEHVFTGRNVQDVMFGEGRWVAATRSSVRSDDDGKTWIDNGTIDVAMDGNTIWNVRAGTYGDGTFLVSAGDGANIDFAYSRDRGATWAHATQPDGSSIAACGAAAPVEGNGVFVTLRNDAAGTTICRSTDSGRTWTVTTDSNMHVDTAPLWTGSEFMAWETGRVYRSADGATWTGADTQTRFEGALSRGPTIGPIAMSSSGTFVSVRGGWQTWYEQQRFYRSTDGVVWEQLPDAAYEKGHPMTEIIFGLAETSSVCR